MRSCVTSRRNTARARCGPRIRRHASLADRWMDWTLADLQPAFIGGVFWNFYRTPEAERNWPAIRQGIARVCNPLPPARQTSRRQALHRRRHTDDRRHCGGRAALSLFRARDRPAADPERRSWYERLSARPAYQRTCRWCPSTSCADGSPSELHGDAPWPTTASTR